MMIGHDLFGKKVFFGRCRNCLHQHSDKNCNEAFIQRNYNEPGCPCKDWAPVDNLEYLEYLEYLAVNKDQ